ncbi:MAG: single-stranded-DNA-specific exonuclease RecJ, partial [Anaerovoracaceae bacterium]
DADGVSSIFVLYEMLKELTDDVGYFIPSRFEDGYGLGIEAIDRLIEEGFELFITVDCGITSINEVQHIKDKGLEILVTDHHTVEAERPNCLIINPKQKDCSYPFPHLAGCGIAFKLAQAIQQKTNISKEKLNSVLGVVALGTVGDIVPLVSENRTIVKYGMKNISKAENIGIKKLMEKLNIDSEKITSRDISFKIVPHINAAGRVGNAEKGLELLLSMNEIDADKIAEELISLNQQRKNFQNECYLECKDLIVKDTDIILIRMDEANEGIIGIVAGRLAEDNNKPVIIITKSGDSLKGTARSIETVNIYEILFSSYELFTNFGGHSAACGFSLEEKNFEQLNKEIAENAKKSFELIESRRNAEPNYDLKVELSGLEMLEIQELERLEPCGHSNEKPVFKLTPSDVIFIKELGEDKQHLKFTAKVDNGDKIECISFNVKEDLKERIFNFESGSLYGELAINEWMERKNLQMLVKEVR